jgi:hypothetical protein
MSTPSFSNVWQTSDAGCGSELQTNSMPQAVKCQNKKACGATITPHAPHSPLHAPRRSPSHVHGKNRYPVAVGQDPVVKLVVAHDQRVQGQVNFRAKVAVAKNLALDHRVTLQVLKERANRHPVWHTQV